MVVLDQRCRLVKIHLDPVSHRFRRIIWPLVKFRPIMITDSGLCRRIEQSMENVAIVRSIFGLRLISILL
jgi:hypothetical protein